MFLFPNQAGPNGLCPGCQQPSQAAPEPIIMAALRRWGVPSVLVGLAAAKLRAGISIPYCPACGIVFARVR